MEWNTRGTCIINMEVGITGVSHKKIAEAVAAPVTDSPQPEDA